MPSRRSIAVYCYRESEPRFLLLKRVSSRGGFWQPVTGSVEESDGLLGGRARYRDVIAGVRRAGSAGDVVERENLLVAALREVSEETGIEDVLTVVDLGAEARFEGFDGVTYQERSFAAEFPDDAQIAISHEHEDARWVTLEEALELLHFDQNRDALRALGRFLAADPATDELKRAGEASERGEDDP